jgi:hypothetical protein
MNTSKIRSKLDSVGMTASALCAIHCAVVPIVLTALPLIGLGFLANPWIEWFMISSSLLIAGYSIGSSYFYNHRRFLPLILMTIGCTFVICGHTLNKEWIESIIVPVGGLTIAAAHFVNIKCLGSCQQEKSIDLKYIQNEEN